MKHSENQSILDELISLSSPEKAEILSRFFKTGKGQYGEGDKLLGIPVPMIRSVAVSFADLPLEAIDELVSSPWHEVRMCGLLILVGQMKQTCKKAWTKHHTKAEAEAARKRIFDFYLSHTEHINNWDLVDLTCPAIVGGYLIGKSHDILYRLADSPLLWERRIAMVSTLAFIRLGDLGDTFSLASHFLAQQDNESAPKMHDLMQKAIGWMLREAGKKDERSLLQFLDANAAIMPRTMLRYSIERLTPAVRLRYMKGDIQ
jgi:3-methyladenine DNA glycosylase AlkD